MTQPGWQVRGGSETIRPEPVQNQAQAVTGKTQQHIGLLALGPYQVVAYVIKCLGWINWMNRIRRDRFLATIEEEELGDLTPSCSTRSM